MSERDDLQIRKCGPDPRTHVFNDGADVCACGRMRQAKGRVELQEVAPLGDVLGVAYTGYEATDELDEEPLLSELSKTETGRFKASKVNPSHYDGDACMRAIHFLGFARPFCIGQAIKYLWRAGRKRGESVEDDVAKAQWYLAWLRGVQGDRAPLDGARHMLEVACDLMAKDEFDTDRLAALVHHFQYLPEYKT